MWFMGYEGKELTHGEEAESKGVSVEIRNHDRKSNTEGFGL